MICPAPCHGHFFPTPPPRPARPRGSARHTPRHRRDARLHAGRHAGHGQGAHARRCCATPVRESSSATLTTSTLRPGDELIRDLGGLHKFMHWDGPILTDSGGFQVFSLASQVKITDHGAKFRSHIDGTPLELTPERAVEIQQNLGSDIAMVLDECPPADSRPRSDARRRRAHDPLGRALQAAPHASDQAQFAIVQGGPNLDLRGECARRAWSPSTSPATRSAGSASASRRRRCTRSCPPARRCCQRTNRVT